MSCIPLSLGLLFASAAPASFPHALHVVDNSVECTTCHETQPEGLPKLDAEGCLDCHSDGAPPYVFTAKARRLWAAFPHAKHDRKVACADCHKAIVTPEWTQGGPMLEQKDCVACHAQNDVSVPLLGCAQCHGLDARKARPPDHDGNWPIVHSAKAQLRAFPQHGKDCILCHGGDACVRCHTTQAPRSHNALWRVRTHGYAANWDRDRCKTCHETGGCIRCHAVTPPLNHAGAWQLLHGVAAARADNATCLVCHRASQCAACHRAQR